MSAETRPSRQVDPGDFVIFFGCWDQPGHGYHDRHGQWLDPEQRGPWGNSIDSLHDYGGQVPQGTRYMAHKDGWTALDIVDRTGDSRPGSHSVFLAPALLSELDMIALALYAFPAMCQRIGLSDEVLADAFMEQFPDRLDAAKEGVNVGTCPDHPYHVCKCTETRAQRLADMGLAPAENGPYTPGGDQ